MASQDSEILECHRLDPFDADCLEQIREAFTGATPLTMRQAWRTEPEPGFLPATIRTGWRDDSLLIFAELPDADIFNAATALNQETWLLGDVLEVFLQAEGQAGYVEFQVTPGNILFQKSFLENGPAQLIPGRAFDSQTWIDRGAQCWWVYMEIPALPANRRWRFSFSRYDYTRDRPHPIISSTSAHAEPDFHRVHEWGTLCLQP